MPPRPMPAGRRRRAARACRSAGGFQLVYSRLVDPGRKVATNRPALAARRCSNVLEPLGLALQPVDAHGPTRSFARRRRSTRSPASGKPRLRRPGNRSPRSWSRPVVMHSRPTCPTSKTSLTQTQIDALPRLGEDVLKAVHRLPGAASNGLRVSRTSAAATRTRRRSCSTGCSSTSLFTLRLLQSPSSVLDERVVGGLDVYAGGFTAEYGDQMSAVIDARFVHPDADAYYELGLSLLHANALASHRFGDGRGQWLAAVRRSNLDEVADVLQSTLGEPRYVDAFRAPRLRVVAVHARQPARACWPATRPRSTVPTAPNTRTRTIRTRMSGPRSSTTGPITGDRGARFVHRRRVPRDATVTDPGRRDGVGRRRTQLPRGRTEARRAVQRPNAGCTAPASTCARSARATTTRARVVFAPGYPFPGLDGHRTQRASSPSRRANTSRSITPCARRLTDALTAEAGRALGRSSRMASMAMTSSGRALNLAWQLAATHAAACELGPIPAVPGHRGTAGRGRHRQVLSRRNASIT